MVRVHQSLKILVWLILTAGLLALSGAETPRGVRKSSQPAWAPGMKAPAQPVSPGEAKVRQDLSYGNIPLYFVPNKGQVGEAARFYARASRYTLWLTAEGLVFDRSVGKERADGRNRQPAKKEAEGLRAGVLGESTRVEFMHPEGRERDSWSPVESGSESRNVDVLRQEDQPAENKREVHRLVFMGANPEPKIEGEGGTGHIANYFIGSDPGKWHTNIATSRAAVYKELYPNIDLKIYGVERQIEYDWLVKAGGDPEAIDFAYEDVLGTGIDAEGDLIIRTELGEFRHRKPTAYQETAAGARESVDARFRKIGPDRYGFNVGRYDSTRSLIIDPVVLIYSTYLGGSDIDRGYGIAVDSSGCAYITGTTYSIDFPTRNPLQETIQSTYDGFVTKLSPTGDSLIYSTYLGGEGSENSRGIAVDDYGSAYVTGETYSVDFPTRIPFQPNIHGSCDTFIAKLSPAGNGLSYSTYLGGSGSDFAFGIAVDNSSCACVTGGTQSADFPIRNSFQANNQGSNEAFVTKLSPAGNDLLYSTYLGGSSFDYAVGIAVDSASCAYITGWAVSNDFPVQNPFQPNNRGDFDVFVAKFSATGDKLIYSTYLGGSRQEGGHGIALDSSGCAYITGVTWSNDFPMQNPFQASRRGYWDAFLVKLSASGDSLVYSTYLGGSSTQEAYGIAVDDPGCASIVGFTYSADFPIRSPFQAALRGTVDCFVTKFTPSGDGLIYSTYLGGSDQDYGLGISEDGAGCTYVVGETMSADYPIQNPFLASYQGGGYDCCVTKIDMVCAVTAAVSGAGGTVSPATQTVVAGETGTINIYPDSGYTIASITDNGGAVAVANPYVINNVREDHDVVVTFARVFTVTATVSGEHGYVSPAAQTAIAGGSATVNIYPDLGYHIGSIRDNGVSVVIVNPYIITNVQEDHAVVVTFANAPPTIKIVNPTNGAKVYGIVTVKAEASDDLRVLKVAFLIDEQLIGEGAFAESTNIYTQAWDTRGYTFGTHKVKAVAFDEAGLTAEDEIYVIIENVALTLQGQRLTESAWILKKQFIRLTIGIQNFGQVSVAKYVVYRKNGTGNFRAIKEIPGSDVTGPSYVWDDMSINKNLKYTYRVLALSSDGVVLGVSNDITL